MARGRGARWETAGLRSVREARERVHAPCGHHHDRPSRRGRVMAGPVRSTSLAAHACWCGMLFICSIKGRTPRRSTQCRHALLEPVSRVCRAEEREPAPEH
eukprot:scaffold75982_cov65-Phaeocystis_antarctica.AAC.3